MPKYLMAYLINNISQLSTDLNQSHNLQKIDIFAKNSETVKTNSTLTINK